VVTADDPGAFNAVDGDPALAARLGSPLHRNDLCREQLQLFQLRRNADTAGRQAGFLRSDVVGRRTLQSPNPMGLTLGLEPAAAVTKRADEPRFGTWHRREPTFRIC
jgi:hypothetical protein